MNTAAIGQGISPHNLVGQSSLIGQNHNMLSPGIGGIGQQTFNQSNTPGYAPPNVAEQANALKRRLEAKVRLVEYFEAQLNLGLFKDALGKFSLEQHLYEAVMQGALLEINKL